MRAGCHSLVFGALGAEAALVEIARAGFETAVLAEIEGQAQHASQLARVPLMPIAAMDVAAHDARRLCKALGYAARLCIRVVVVAPGGSEAERAQRARPSKDWLGGLGERSVPQRLAVTPRAGSAVWNVQTALYLVERFPRLTLWPDTSHLARAGEDLPTAARALAPYSAGWFIRDHDGVSRGPGAFEAQVPGHGALDLDAALYALQDSGFRGPIVFHAVGHLPGGRPRPEYPVERLRALVREARDYLSRYCTSSAERPT